MKFEVHTELKYQVISDCTLILNIHAFKNDRQKVLNESFKTEPFIKSKELKYGLSENRFICLEVPKPCDLSITYEATVENAFEFREHVYVPELQIAKLEPEVLTYLLPSRYCQSDRLYRFANNKFGHLRNDYAKVTALTEWIHANVEYLSGSTNSQTSAFDTVTEQAGVCRDFAHLGIALCRALTIPGRYFTGYAFKLSPPDFHACFEAYINGGWVLFDATKLVPLNGMVKIATGSDAAEVAVASIFGHVNFVSSKVSCECLAGDFEDYYHDPSDLRGISYL